MRIILSVLIFVVLVLWLWTLYFTNKKKFRMVEYNKKEYYLLSRNMYFVIFTVCTAPVFLGSLSLLKYGLWLAVILWLLLSNKVRMVMEPAMVMYLVFFRAMYEVQSTPFYSTVKVLHSVSPQLPVLQGAISTFFASHSPSSLYLQFSAEHLTSEMSQASFLQLQELLIP